MSTATQWYGEFYRAYGKDSKIQALENKSKLTDSQWTDGLREFLRRLAEDLGYQVVTEHKALEAKDLTKLGLSLVKLSRLSMKMITQLCTPK